MRVPLPQEPTRAVGSPQQSVQPVVVVENETARQTEELGRDLMIGGSRLKDVAGRLQDQYNRTRVLAADNKAAEIIRKRMADPQTGYLATIGQAAVDRRKPTFDALGKDLESLGTDLENEDQRQAYHELAARRLNGANWDADQHELKQRKAWEYGETKQHMDGAVDDYVEYWTPSDMAKGDQPSEDETPRTKAQTHRNTAVLDANHLADLAQLPESSEQRKALVREQLTRMHAGVVERLLQQGRDDLAAQYLKQVPQGELDAAVHTKLLGGVQRANMAEESAALARRLQAETAPQEPQPGGGKAAAPSPPTYDLVRDPRTGEWTTAERPAAGGAPDSVTQRLVNGLHDQLAMLDKLQGEGKISEQLRDETAKKLKLQAQEQSAFYAAQGTAMLDRLASWYSAHPFEHDLPVGWDGQIDALGIRKEANMLANDPNRQTTNWEAWNRFMALDDRDVTARYPTRAHLLRALYGDGILQRERVDEAVARWSKIRGEASKEQLTLLTRAQMIDTAWRQMGHQLRTKADEDARDAWVWSLRPEMDKVLGPDATLKDVQEWLDFKLIDKVTNAGTLWGMEGMLGVYDMPLSAMTPEQAADAYVRTSKGEKVYLRDMTDFAKSALGAAQEIARATGQRRAAFVSQQEIAEAYVALGRPGEKKTAEAGPRAPAPWMQGWSLDELLSLGSLWGLAGAGQRARKQ